MKASMHSGRTGNAKHNDRSFLEGKTEQEQKELAPHIDLTKTANNRIGVRGQAEWYSPGEVDIAAVERDFYARRYGVAQDAKNCRYEAQRHPERRRTTDDLYTGRQTRPEEIILQIGSKDEKVSNRIFGACLQDYLKELDTWNREHGNHMHVLSIALHGDETSPHAHIRRCWDYTGRDGPVLGQDKALQAAGVPLPDLEKPKGRYNNRKMTFDAMMRDRWLDICQAHGLDIDREPVPGMRHKDKADYIRDAIGREIEEAKAERDFCWEQASEANKDMLRVHEERSEVMEALQAAQAELQGIRAETEEALARVDVLKASARILSAAEAERIPAEAQTPLWGLLGRDKVMVSREMLKRLVQRARLAEKATEEAITATEGRRRIERQAKEQAREIIAQAQTRALEIEQKAESQALRIEDRAQAEADQIRAQARDDAAEDRAAQELDRRELREYRKLQKRFPEEVRELREASRKLDRQRTRGGSDR